MFSLIPSWLAKRFLRRFRCEWVGTPRVCVSANGAASLTAWGSAPGFNAHHDRALKAQLKATNTSPRELTLREHRNDRTFSAPDWNGQGRFGALALGAS